jgi:predicted Zn-dependent protease with MMP-like domain
MTIDWGQVRAPTLDDFEVLATAAYADLPAEFRRLTGDIVIRVADFADDEVLDALDLESPFELLGLFQGVGRTSDFASPTTGQMPNAIWIYRAAILDYWAENDETLGHIVTHVLIHEIGHHFGLSDADMEALEASVE